MPTRCCVAAWRPNGLLDAHTINQGVGTNGSFLPRIGGGGCDSYFPAQCLLMGPDVVKCLRIAIYGQR